MSEVAKPSEGRTVALGGVAMHARRVTLIREPAPLIFAAIGAAGLGIVAATVASSPTEATLLALVAVLGTFLAIALGIAQRAFLAAVILDLALAWNVHLGFRDEVAELGAIGGLGISLTTLALAALYAGWIGELLAGPSSQSLAPRLRAAAPLVAFVGLSAISLLSAGDVELARFKLAVLVQTLLVFVYIAGRVRTRKDVHFVVTFLLVALLVQSFVLIASALGLPVDLAGISSGAGTSPGGVSRFSGTLGSPNATGGLLAFLLIPAAAVLLTDAGRRFKRFAGLAFVLGTIALVLTLSRGSWLAFTVSMAVLALATLRRHWMTPGTVILAAIGLVLLVAPFASNVSGRVTGDEQAALARLPLVTLSLDVIGDQPWTGVGLNNFVHAIPDYAGPEFSGQFLFITHNAYLLVWAEAGIFALAALAWFLLATLRRAWQVGGAGDPYLSPLALGFAAAIVGRMVHMTVESFQGQISLQPLWIVAALLVVMALIIRADRGPAPTRLAHMRPRSPGAPPSSRPPLASRVGSG